MVSSTYATADYGIHPVLVITTLARPIHTKSLQNTMAPRKQALLPLGMFVKNPTVSTKKKHTKLEKKALGLTLNKKKPFVDKKREQRVKEEKELAEGAEGWRRHLQRAGDPEADTCRTDIMFQAYGPPRDECTGYSNDHQDENHVDFPVESRTNDDSSM